MVIAHYWKLRPLTDYCTAMTSTKSTPEVGDSRGLVVRPMGMLVEATTYVARDQGFKAAIIPPADEGGTVQQSRKC